MPTPSTPPASTSLSATPPTPTPITLLRLKRPRSPPPQTLHLHLPSSKRPRLSSLSLHGPHVSFHQLPSAPDITPQMSVIDLTPSDLVHPSTRKRPPPITTMAPSPPTTRHKPLQSHTQQITCNDVPMARDSIPSTPQEAWYIADNHRSDLGLSPRQHSQVPCAVDSVDDSDNRVYVRMDSSRIPWLHLHDTSDSDDAWEDDSDGEGSVDYPSTPASSDIDDQHDDHDFDSDDDDQPRMPFGYYGLSTWREDNHFSEGADLERGHHGSSDGSYY